MRNKILICMLFVFFGLLLCLHDSLAFSVYTGKVVGVSRRQLQVQGADGSIAMFRVGWRTRYYPNRQPLLGENVKIEYMYDKGENVGYTVAILTGPPAPPPPASPPPPPASPPPPPATSGPPPPVVGPETAISGEIIVLRSANVRSGPASTYPIVAVAHKGRSLRLKGQSKGWYLVYLPERKRVGWVYSGLVRVVKIESPSR